MAEEDRKDAGTVSSAWFTFGREEGFPSRYSDQFTAANFSAATANNISVFVILAICLCLSIVGLHPSRRWNSLVLTVFSLFIGATILVCNFNSNWEQGSVRIKAPYKAGSAEEIKATLGLKIGLRGINITLKVDPKDLEHLTDLRDEKIDYNERFSWQWAQGLQGFGPRAGQFSLDFREAQLKGIPLPILHVAQCFTIDGEGLRIGRYYRSAGWYAHIMMWAAFPTWILTNILLFSAVNLAAFFLFLTGAFQLTAMAIWGLWRNPTDLTVPFESSDGNGLAVLYTDYGGAFYVVYINGLLCVILSLVVFLWYETGPSSFCEFLGKDPSENFYYDYSDESTKPKNAEGIQETALENQQLSGAPTMKIVRRQTITSSVRDRMRKSVDNVRQSMKQRPKKDVETSHQDETFPLMASTQEAYEIMDTLWSPPARFHNDD